jgi:HNH endonuclease
MSSKKAQLHTDRQDQIIAEARHYRDQREKTYRAQALKLYPWICARCGREFSGKKLRELTVHHKDHNHHNNPPDGSNWELLCLYCHENEHARQQVADIYEEATPGEDCEPPATYRPFADLKELLQRKT